MDAFKLLALGISVAQGLSLPKGFELSSQAKLDAGDSVYFDEDGFMLSALRVKEEEQQLGLTAFAQTHAAAKGEQEQRGEQQQATASILRSSGAHPWSYCNTTRAGPQDKMGDMEDEANFVKFFQSIGGSKLKLALASVGQPLHRGTVAKQDIKDGDILLSVPLTGVMSASGEEIESALGHLWGKSEQQVLESGASPFWYTNGKPNFHRRLALWLLVEKSKGQDSRWAPYLKMLPKKLNLPLDYDATELDLLRGTSIFSNVLQQRQRIKKEYDMLFPMLAEKDKATFAKGSYDLEDWKWARGIVNSRCMVFPGAKGNDMGLVPFADMVNHHNVPVSWISYQGRLGLKTAMPFKEGDEVFMNYGHLTNQYLLQVYGFVLPDNEFKINAGGRDVPCPDVDCVKALSMSTTLVQDETLLEKKQQSQTFNYVNALILRIEEQELLKNEKERFTTEQL